MTTDNILGGEMLTSVPFDSTGMHPSMDVILPFNSLAVSGERLPLCAGIYQITCGSNLKIYVGSTVNLRHRLRQHCKKLRQGRHPNAHLQSAWNKFGESDCTVSVIEVVGRDKLLLAEQLWIERTKCCQRDIGFNIYPTAGSPGNVRARTWEGFVDPSGLPVVITNLFDYCRTNQLDFPSMHRLASGKSKLKSYKGWTHRNSVRQRDYVKTYTGFIAPNGQAIDPITNLAAFCREHDLDPTHMVAVSKGRILSHHGWHYVDQRAYRNPPKTYMGFVDPSGIGVTITNLAAFCRQYQLSVVHMRGLVSGKRKTHKGWTWKGNS